MAPQHVDLGGVPVVEQSVLPGGRVVLDLSGPGTGLHVHQVHLRSGSVSSTSFPWALLGRTRSTRSGGGRAS